MLEIKNLTKSYGDFRITDLNLSVKRNEYYVILGVSGAGKTLLLEMIAGLTVPDKGEIYFEDRDITYEKIQKRKVGLVFQDHAIFPHMTVRENIAYGMKNKNLDSKEITSRVHVLTEQMAITSLIDRKPWTLSGGELQRVALARTLASEPHLLLLDEPLASLDVQIRKELRQLLRQIHQSGQTIIHVTHDYEEAISLATGVAILHKGTIFQTGTPDEVFHHPKSEFVANFIGIKNFFPARLKEVVITSSDKVTMAVINDKLSIGVLTEDHDREGFIMIRGEDILISNTRVETSAINHFEGKITDIHPGIHGIELHIDCGIDLVAVISKHSLQELHLFEGKMVWISIKASAVKFLEK